MERTGEGVGIGSGRLGSTYAAGSRMWPMRPLAQMSACTPSSQGKKSFFEVRTGMWVMVGKALEEGTIAEKGEKGKEEGGYV